MKVIASPGIRVPKESKPRDFITDEAICEVPASAYYLRMIACGDLLEQPEGPAKKTAKKGND